MAKRSVLIGWLFLLGGVATCATLAPPSPPRTEAETGAERLLMAMIRCSNQTKSQLADPTGFDPEPFGDWRVIPKEDGGFDFTFRARARNGFGALIWGEFACSATHDGTAWKAVISPI